VYACVCVCMCVCVCCSNQATRKETLAIVWSTVSSGKHHPWIVRLQLSMVCVCVFLCSCVCGCVCEYISVLQAGMCFRSIHSFGVLQVQIAALLHDNTVTALLEY